MILPTLEGWDYTSLLMGVVILGGLLVVFILKRRFSIRYLHIYLLFSVSLLIPNTFMHSGLGIMVAKYLLMMLALFWLYHNVDSQIMKTRYFKRLAYFTISLLVLNQALSMTFGLGEVHLNSGILFKHRYYGYLGDSVSLYVFFLWKYFDVIYYKQTAQNVTVLIALSMGSKIVLLLIVLDFLYKRVRRATIIYTLISLLSLLSLFWIIYSFDFINIKLIQYSLSTRLLQNTWALQTFIENPLGGVGFNQTLVKLALEDFYKIAEDGVTFKVVLVDNTLLRLLAENGLFGLICYILVFIILLKKTEGKEMFYFLLLLQTFYWLEPISSALFSVMLIGFLYRKQ